MEEPHIYEMIGNPSYATTQVKASTSTATKPKKTSRVNKLAVVAVIVLIFVVMLAAGSIAIAFMAYFNTRTDITVADMQAQITQLTQDFDITKVRNNQLTATCHYACCYMTAGSVNRASPSHDHPGPVD